MFSRTKLAFSVITSTLALTLIVGCAQRATPMPELTPTEVATPTIIAMVVATPTQAAVATSTPTTTPVSTPFGEYSSPILNRWVDSHLHPRSMPAIHALEFLPDGTIILAPSTEYACAGSYELSGENRILIRTDSCASPEIATGLYEYALDSHGETLVLSQQFQSVPPSSVNSSRWYQEENDYVIEFMPDGSVILGDRCSGEYSLGIVGPDDTVTLTPLQLIGWIECKSGNSPLTAAYYEAQYVEDGLILSRRFERVNP